MFCTPHSSPQVTGFNKAATFSDFSFILSVAINIEARYGDTPQAFRMATAVLKIQQTMSHFYVADFPSMTMKTTAQNAYD